jgi:hypothetical protein
LDLQLNRLTGVTGLASLESIHIDMGKLDWEFLQLPQLRQLSLGRHTVIELPYDGVTTTNITTTILENEPEIDWYWQTFPTQRYVFLRSLPNLQLSSPWRKNQHDNWE